MELPRAPKSCQEKTIPHCDLDQTFVGKWGWEIFGHIRLHTAR